MALARHQHWDHCPAAPHPGREMSNDITVCLYWVAGPTTNFHKSAFENLDIVIFVESAPDQARRIPQSVPAAAGFEETDMQVLVRNAGVRRT